MLGSPSRRGLANTRLKISMNLIRKLSVSPRRSTWFAVTMSVLIVAVTGGRAHAQLCVQLNGGTYTQNFNTLAVSGSSNIASTIPIGFSFSESGTGNNITYAASDG